jgi:hypothetical protein
MSLMANPCEVGIHNYYQDFNIRNKIFDPASYRLGNYLGDGFIQLKKLFNENGININTLDMIHPTKCKKIIFIDYPTGIEQHLAMLKQMGVELYLIIFENEMIKSDNYITEQHTYFNKVFTMDERLLKLGDKYIKMYTPNKIPDDVISGNKRDKLVCMMASNKSVDNYIGELYSERKNIIKFYEENYPDDFDLWGYGWNIKENPSYKGCSDNKLKTLSNYRFSFCYENLLNDYGYVTEKIFDSLFAGTIPIYMGYKNLGLRKYTYIVPELEKDGKVNYNKLHKLMLEMPEDEYNRRIKDIKALVCCAGSGIEPYKSENFAKVIAKGMFE